MSRPDDERASLFDLDQPSRDAPSDDRTAAARDDAIKRIGREALPELPKRFYTSVTIGVGESPTRAHAILLDGRPVRTPGKQPLAVSHYELAEAIATEWREQGERIDPETMPLTRLSNTILDGVSANMDRLRNEIVEYAGSDLLCYRAESPAQLVALQNAHWDPPIAWAEARLGATFKLAGGIMPVAQPDETLEAVRDAIAAHDPFRLGAMHVAMTLTGSSLLALALVERAQSPDEAWAAAHVDEDWQISQWGEDEEAMARRTRRRREFDAACFVLSGETQNT